MAIKQLDFDQFLADAKERAKNRTPEERRQLLIDAHILDEEGNYDERFFSRETIEKDKQYRLNQKRINSNENNRK